MKLYYTNNRGDWTSKEIRNVNRIDDETVTFKIVGRPGIFYKIEGRELISYGRQGYPTTISRDAKIS